MEMLNEVNKWLKDKYGMFDPLNQNFRVVWSEDQKEKRKGVWTDYSTEGLYIRTVEEIREVPKYGYISHKFILERIIPIEAFGRKDAVDKISYEPIWTFKDAADNALMPHIGVCHYVIETLFENIAKRAGVKYKNPFTDVKIQKEVLLAEKRKMYDLLYGEETHVTDALARGSGITVPELPSKEKADESSTKSVSTN